MPLLPVRLCCAFLLGALPYSGTAAEPTATASSFSLRLTRGSCEGSCPIYSIDVDHDGRVRWQGERFVKHKGTARKTITQSRLLTIVRRTRELQILALQPGVHACLDSPLVTIDLTLDGRSISVAYCVGDARPEGFRVIQFADFIDRALLDEAWVGGKEYRRMN